MGAGEKDYRQLAQEMEMSTGGFSASPSINIHHSGLFDFKSLLPIQLRLILFADLAQFDRRLILSSFALEKNADKMLSIWTDLFNRPRFDDTDRLKTLLANVRRFTH